MRLGFRSSFFSFRFREEFPATHRRSARARSTRAANWVTRSATRSPGPGDRVLRLGLLRLPEQGVDLLDLVEQALGDLGVVGLLRLARRLGGAPEQLVELGVLG